MTDQELHARRAHPDWEYATTEGPRKQWDDIDVPPRDSNGNPDHSWERNTDAGRDGWDRFDYTEESYWRRPKAAPTPAREAAVTQPSPADEALIDQIAAAIYEWSCQPYKWADAHPDDLLAYRGDAIAVMATVVKPLQERAEKAEADIERLTSSDAVRAAAFAISDYALTHLGRDLGTIHIEPMAEAGIRAALDDQPKE